MRLLQVWGHSLGAAIAVHFLASLSSMSPPPPHPCGLVLMSPFNNVSANILQRGNFIFVR